MLQKLNDKAQGAMWIVLVLLAGIFLLWGLSDYFSMGGKSSFAAKINGEKISWQTIDTLYQRAQKQQQASGNMQNEKELKQQIRLDLVRRIALLGALKKMGFAMSDEQTAKVLFQIPAFQIDGKFSKERYLEALASFAYNDTTFRHELSQDLLLGQLEYGLAFSSFTLNDELKQTVSLIDQVRDIRYVKINSEAYKNKVKITPEQIKTYYEGHQAEFIKPEEVKIQYITLNAANLAKEIEVSKDELKAYYDQHQAEYGSPERLQVRHILIAAPANNKKLEEEAKAKAEQWIKEIKHGSDFAELAKKNSADTGSAKSGGDLGWISRGQLVPEFEKAAFAIAKKGDLAGPVRTQFGYHIIQLQDKKAAETRPFTEVQKLVEEQVKRDKALVLFVEKNEALAKLAAEQNEKLEPIASAMGLTIEESEPFNRQGGQTGIATQTDVIKAAFAEEVLTEHRNSQLLKVGDDNVVLLRVKEHYPAKQLELKTVEKTIQEKLVSEEAIKLAKSQADSIASKIEKDQSADLSALKLKWESKKGLTRVMPDFDRTILNAAFQAPQPEDGKPSVKVFELPSHDFVVLEVENMIPGSMAKIDPETLRGYRQSLTDISQQLEFMLYANKIFNETKVEWAKD